MAPASMARGWPVASGRIALLTVVVLAAATPARAADFHVSPAGRDDAPGTAERPFATLARAQAAVRRLVGTAPPGRAIVVVVHDGTYHLAEPLTFRPEDGGTAQAPVIYQAAPGARPVLSGGRPVSGFRVGRDGRWRVRLPEVAAGRWSFSQLFVGGERRPRPRLPAEGFFTVDERVPLPEGGGAKGFDRFRFRAGDLRRSWSRLEDVELLAFHVWSASRLRIAAIDETAREVRFTGTTASRSDWAAFKPGHRYYVENVKEALGRPGEWYLDRPSGELTYVPRPGESPGATPVIAPRLANIVVLAGDVAGRRWVQHLRFAGLVFAHASWTLPPTGHAVPQAEMDVDGAITAVGARDVIFERCAVRRVGGYGFAFGPGSRDNQVESCELADLGAGGIKIGPHAARDLQDPEAHVRGHVVRDTLITRGGRMHPAAVGVWIGHASHNVIEHNEISDLYYTGVSVGWVWGFGPSVATHNRIAWNHIHTIGQRLLSDMGGVYLLGVAPGTVVEGNVVHDVDSFGYGGWGLYTDEGSSHVVLRNNLVYRTKDGGFDQHYGRANLITNNIFALGRECLVRRNDRKDKHTSFAFVRNIVLGDKSRMLCGEWTGGPESTFSLDHNLYFALGGAPLEFDGRSFEAWRATGQDRGSLVADPLFVAPERGDFTLRPGSPAAKIGFVPFDFRKAGRRVGSAR